MQEYSLPHAKFSRKSGTPGLLKMKCKDVTLHKWSLRYATLPPPISLPIRGLGSPNWGVAISCGHRTVMFVPACISTDDTRFSPANKGSAMLSQWTHWSGGRQVCLTCSAASVIKHIESTNFKRALAMLKEVTVASNHPKWHFKYS